MTDFALRSVSKGDFLSTSLGLITATVSVFLVAGLVATEVFPVRISIKLLFIALHIICVKNSPEAPTIPPTAINRISLIAIPAIAPATPLSEFSKEIVMGISAPPTRIANAYPNKRLITVATIIRTNFSPDISALKPVITTNASIEISSKFKIKG